MLVPCFGTNILFLILEYGRILANNKNKEALNEIVGDTLTNCLNEA